MSITEAELMEALAASIASTAPEDAKTVQQMATATGVPASRVIKTLHTLSAEGRVRVHRIPHMALDGRRCTVPGYTILPAPKAKRGR